MLVRLAHVRAALKQFEWRTLFIEELGWNRASGRPDSLTIDGRAFTLEPIAQQSEMTVYLVRSAGENPSYALRQKIERRAREKRFEHILIFEDAQQQEAIFQWVKRGQGPGRSREYRYHRDDGGELLVQRLAGIAFELADLDEQGKIDIANVTARVAKAFDAERVTKRFYDEFTRQRDAFQRFLQGIPIEDEQRWYVSVMLNRLMFIYFVQTKGFLNHDQRYLQQQLASSQRRGPDRYYAEFLRTLFFEGFAREEHERSAEVRQLLGRVPYLNGGLFLPHQLEERYGAAIAIPDAAFERLFAFFDQWRWHLSERPGTAQNEIDPDVLGFIFEKYINQKQMGAYYTKEDITAYICRSTIISALFEKAQLSLAPLELQRTAEAYLFPAMTQAERLPTETEREQQARRARVAQVRAAAADGQLATIQDAITYNLNLEALIFDLIPRLDAQAVWQLYRALLTLSVLDPTCGSGAFLFAAIRILWPIYDLLLDRMERLRDFGRASGEMQAVLSSVAEHPSTAYFITKSIIVRNLYGVDIMEEAVEICKLRLFLRLVADLEDAEHIEPLPDIDFNIRAGNALVGYASVEEIGGAVKGSVVSLSKRQQRLVDKIKDVQREMRFYRAAQLEHNPSSAAFRETRQQLRAHLAEVDDELNNDLLQLKMIHVEPDGGFNTQPFHWFTAFYEILDSGGFDVIVGNPPYVVYSKARANKEYKIYGYKTETCGNLYAYVIERSKGILKSFGWLGMIVPIASVSTSSMAPLQTLYRSIISWHSHYAVRPGKLFVGVDMNLTISILQNSHQTQKSFVTGYKRWSSNGGDREFIFDTLAYTENMEFPGHPNPYPKLGSVIEAEILQKMLRPRRKIKDYISKSGRKIFYHSGGRYWRKALLDGLSSHYKPILIKEEVAPVVLAILNSQLFYWYWISNSNCMDVVAREVEDFPVFPLENARSSDFELLTERLLSSYYAYAETRERQGEFISGSELNFDVQRSKPIIDEIDRVLAEHYGLTEEELDFIINYDIKYRMGRGDDEGDAGASHE